MPILFELIFYRFIIEAFAGKNQGDVLLLILENLAGSKGIFVRGPAGINPQLRFAEIAGDMKVLVPQAGDHRFHNAHIFGGGLAADDSCDSGHEVFGSGTGAGGRN